MPTLRRPSASPSWSSVVPRLLAAPVWVLWAALALAFVSDPVMKALGLGENAWCTPDSVRFAQLAPVAAAPVVLLGFRRTWVALLAFVVLLVAWWLLGVSADCSFGGDD